MLSFTHFSCVGLDANSLRSTVALPKNASFVTVFLSKHLISICSLVMSWILKVNVSFQTGLVFLYCGLVLTGLLPMVIWQYGSQDVPPD